jgi:FkbM family methyltransferase
MTPSTLPPSFPVPPPIEPMLAKSVEVVPASAYPSELRQEFFSRWKVRACLAAARRVLGDMMRRATRKFTTASRVYRAEGIRGVFSVVQERFADLHRERWATLEELVRLFAPVLPQTIINTLPFSGVVCVNILPSKRLYLELTHDGTARNLLRHGTNFKGGETIDLFVKLMKRAGTVLDIGANSGIFSLLAAVDDPRRRVISFEPVPANFARLQWNIRLNRLRNVVCSHSALTNHDGSVTLYVPPGILPTEASTLEGFRQNTVPLSVEATTLDSFASRHHLTTVDLMKLDTEGTEDLVLEGARSILSRDRPVMLCEVLKLKRMPELALHDHLDTLGYRYFWITGRGLLLQKPRIEGDGSYQYLNYLLIPDEKIQTYLIGQGIIPCAA